MASQPTAQMPSRLRNLLGLTAGAVLLLGLLGAWLGLQEVRPTASATNLLGDFVQLFKFDWQKPADYDGDIPATLALAQVLLPVSALALIGLYGVQSIARWAGQQVPNRVIVVGDGTAAATIADHLSQQGGLGGKVVRVDTGDKQALRDSGVRFARAVVVCGDDANDAARNVTVAGTAFAENRRGDFTAHVLVGDPGLALALRARRLVQADDGNRRLRVSNVDELAARHHLSNAPIPRHATPHLLVVGATTFGREIIVEFARQRAEREADQPTDRPVVTLVAANAHAAVEEIDDRWPFVRHVLEIHPITKPLHDAMLEMPQRPYRSYFCDDDEVQAMRDALTAATRWEPERDSVVVRTSGLTARSDAFARLFDDLGGALVTVSRYHAAAESVLHGIKHPQAHLEEFARAIHKGYLDEARRRQRPTGSAPNLIPWEQLTPALKAGNIEQAKDFGRRLAVIHCTVAPRTRLAVPFFFRPGEVETLARNEHQKWRGSNRNVRAWEEMTPEMRAISRAIVVETPLRYDKILEREGLQIVRLASAPVGQVAASTIALTDDQIERMAQKVHEEFLAFEQAHGKNLYDPSAPAMKPWAELDETFRAASRAQARDIPAKLDLLELQLVPADPGPSVDFDEDMVEMLARYEHERWMAERVAAGLTYGPTRTDRTHPALVPWLYLSDEVQEKDRSTIRTIPAVVAAAGFALRRAVAPPKVAVQQPRADNETTLIIPR